ncbi:DNA-binding transcriptional LysR family regulator [Pullulanibacillus pueri]|uniref:Putative HTH-type transcriptional regulator YwbI n=1 Tax=Pullulanibacillus pueri TaxID=1437324 RepID=A0A8J2ZUE5_9BACL|nr:LysR family transcriptional regulator [Pullulanibacillus pueri]MBM7680797.1 DNA-binding transcriptional LysR family regulator [Pullulanibacillus pueri]GGH78371.1 putative HTH-type transcriptional regulator YwbI [Pullulanibacillus pueri]
MDIRHLQYFIEVAHWKNFTKAANHLYVTQPTISKMVKNLEEELGVELFDRSGKQVELTDAGSLILKQAQSIFHSFQNMTHALDDLRNLKTGHIRIGLPPMIGSRFFPKVIGGFREHYPDVMLQLVEHGAKKIEEEVGNGTLDIGVVLLPTEKDIFHSFSFVKENVMLVVHPEHVLSERHEVYLVELKEEAFILFREDFALHDRIIKACLSVGFSPRIVSESSQWDLISEMVAADLGVALLPETICKSLEASKVKVIRLSQPAIPWHLAVVWRKDHYLPFAAREWLRFTRTMMREIE